MTQRRLASPKVLTALAVIQAADAAVCVSPIKPIKESLEQVGLPRRVWWVLPVVKSASAAGLAGGIWWAPLGRLTSFMLAVYFTLAVGAHVRVRDSVVHMLPAASLLILFAVLAGKGFDERSQDASR